MNLFRNRPLATCCMIFLLFMTVAANTDSLTKLWLGGTAVFFLLALLLVFRHKKRKLPRLAPLCVLLALIALLNGYLQFDRRFSMAEIYTGEVTICARVHEITYANGSALGLTADCETVDGKKDNRRITVWAYTKLQPKEGDLIILRAQLEEVTDEESLALYLRAKGVAARAEEVFDLTIQDTRPTPKARLRACFSNLRSSLGAHLSTHIPGNSGLLMRALLLGEQELLPDTLKLQFRRTGLSHVLSLSGLHISLLSAMLAALCHRLRCPKTGAMIGQILLVLFYMALTGFSLSITRAGLMTLLFALSFFARREADGITSLSCAAVLITLFSPTAVYDCGFWLSVFATYGILIHNEWQKPRTGQHTHLARLGYATLDALSISFAATLATLPLTAFFFGELSLIGPLCNLLLIPFFNLYLLLSALSLLLSPLSWFSGAAGAFGALLLSAVKQIASLRGLMLSVNAPLVKLLLSLLLILFFLCLCSRMGRKRLTLVGLGCLALLTLCLGTTVLYRATVNGVYYGYAGSNEMLLLQSGQQGILCDASNGSYTAQKYGLQAAKQAGITELEGYLMTHYHTRHADSFPRLCGQILVHTLYLPIPKSAEEEVVYRRLVSEAEELGIACVLYEPYKDIAFGDLTVHPHKRGESDSAHPTLGFSVRHGEQLLTYLGKGHHESDQKATVFSAVAQSNVLIFGLHGGKETAPPHYKSYSSALSCVALPYRERIPASLADFLAERIRIASENDFLWLPL